jgi:dihydropteroate synthase
MKSTLNIRGQLFSLERPVVMGILNATPDSFYAGSRTETERDIAQRATQIVEEGGSFIDVGAFSTRPGAQEVAEEEECRRLQQALRIVRREVPDAIISVDTFRPSIARRSVEEWGADIINDVSEDGLTGIVGTPIHEQERMSDVVAQLHVPYILMSVQPDIRQMLMNFSRKVADLHAAGVSDIILDPGFGFGKTLDENYEILGQLEILHTLGCPLLVGMSRKSMVSKVLGITADEALNGTTVVHTLALQAGADILRVHDVRAACEAVALVEKTKAAMNNHNPIHTHAI